MPFCFSSSAFVPRSLSCWTISAATQHQNVDHTPYEGFECHGRAHLVYVNGELVARDGEPTGAKPGQYVAR